MVIFFKKTAVVIMVTIINGCGVDCCKRKHSFYFDRCDATFLDEQVRDFILNSDEINNVYLGRNTGFMFRDGKLIVSMRVPDGYSGGGPTFEFDQASCDLIEWYITQ